MEQNAQHNRRCPFCDVALHGRKGEVGTKSNEHIISQWLLDHLALRHEPVTSQVFDIPTQQTTDYRQVTATSFVNGRICRSCNNGWMAQLEGQVKPILVRLIADPRQLTSLTAYEQNIIALWTVKTAGVLNRAFKNGDPKNPHSHPIPHEHLRDVKAGKLPPEIVVVASGCPSGWPSSFIESANWAVMPKNSIPLTDLDRKRSYKIGMSFGSLLLGVAYYPNSDYYYAVRRDEHSILWGSTSRVVRLTDKDAIDVPVLANLPIMEGFLGNIALISKVMWDLIQNTHHVGLIAKA